MSVQSRIKQQARPVSVTALSGAAPQTGAGSAFPVDAAEPFTLSATAYAQATTNNLTITGKWQARNSVGSGTWRDFYGPNGAANVVMVTGTGAAVAATRSIAAPSSIVSVMEARFVLVTGAEAAGAGDEYSVSYNYRDTLMRRRPVIAPNKMSVTAVTGNAGTTIGGPVVTIGNVQPGTLCALVYGQATTNLLTLTGKWQVSETGLSGGTWYDARLMHAPTDVTIVTGTGSAVADTRFYDAPLSVYGYKFARFALVTGGAAGGAGDEYQISYQFLRPFA